MSKIFIVANLKSHKTESEAKQWLESFKNIKDSADNLIEKEIIICPSFTLLQTFSQFIADNNLNVKLGSQNVSEFDEGAYTGEENAKQIKDFADYVLIGHSERRSNFNETDEVLSKKVELSKKYQLTPIFFVQGKDNVIPEGIELIAYEPVFAIGSGQPDSPENADQVAGGIKSGERQILYGGSVTSSNVKDFTSKPNISGVVVGGASLDPEEFIKIIQNA